MTNEKEHFRFFQNRQCEYFPCHSGIEKEDFSCMFCFCPLYALGKACGGSFVYTESGVKNCSGCAFPHRRENHAKILARHGEIMAVIRRVDEEGL